MFLGRKAVTNLDSVLKSRDITLLTKVYWFKNEEKKVKVAQLCQTFCDLWTIQSIEFSRSEYGGSCFFFQVIFPTQGLNPGFLHCKWIIYHLNHLGSPRILEWVAYPFSSGFCWPRNEPESPALQADSLPTELLGKP